MFQYPIRSFIVTYRCREIGSLIHCIALKFDRGPGSSAIETPFKFQGDRIIVKTWLWDFLRSYDGTSNAILKLIFMLVQVWSSIIFSGDIIDQDALVDALQTNEIRGAALDVTSPEPLPRDHPLLDLPNVVISPHIGTVTYGCRERMVTVVLDNLKAALLDNVPMPNEIGL